MAYPITNCCPLGKLICLYTKEKSEQRKEFKADLESLMKEANKPWEEEEDRIHLQLDYIIELVLHSKRDCQKCSWSFGKESFHLQLLPYKFKSCIIASTQVEEVFHNVITTCRHDEIIRPKRAMAHAINEDTVNIVDPQPSMSTEYRSHLIVSGVIFKY